MTDEEAVAVLIQGFGLLFNQARVISLLPIEDWIEILDRAYPDGLASGKTEAVKKLLRSALDLKRTVEDIKADVLSGKVSP